MKLLVKKVLVVLVIVILAVYLYLTEDVFHPFAASVLSHVALKPLVINDTGGRQTTGGTKFSKLIIIITIIIIYIYICI